MWDELLTGIVNIEINCLNRSNYVLAFQDCNTNGVALEIQILSGSGLEFCI